MPSHQSNDAHAYYERAARALVALSGSVDSDEVLTLWRAAYKSLNELAIAVFAATTKAEAENDLLNKYGSPVVIGTCRQGKSKLALAEEFLASFRSPHLETRGTTIFKLATVLRETFGLSSGQVEELLYGYTLTTPHPVSIQTVSCIVCASELGLRGEACG